MRIALVNISLKAGRGSDQVTIDLAERLAEFHEVTVYSLRPVDHQASAYATVAPSGGSLWQVLEFIRRRRHDLNAYDVVNCHHAIVSLCLPRGRLITTYHGFTGRLNLRLGKAAGGAISRLIRRFVVRPSLARSKAVVLVSAALEAEVRQARNRRTEIIYSGVSSDDVVSANTTPAHMIYVGRLDPDKNVRGLLEVYRAAGPLPPLLVVGDGELRRELERDFSGPMIRFLGRVDRKTLRALYSGAHAFVTASLFETFCLPVIEAAQRGIPTIAARVGAFPEVVVEGRTGWLADDFARDGPELLRKVAALSPEQREAIGRDCREWAARFSWDNALQQYCALYAEIAAGPAR